jgi:dTDP-4-amino-4,6-dideoxygalactose transaminase
MFRFGKPELKEIAKVAASGMPFRYRAGSQCARFENRYGKMLGVKYVHMTASGSTALQAALAAVGIGPGDEVIIPCHTYMATATSVLAVGAIPVLADIDETLMLDPRSLESQIGPRTKAVMPVHMWGQVCDMGKILRIARKHKLLVIEDACQCVGGSYEGKMAGSFGQASAFSFNYFKNMTCGEGGAVVMNDQSFYERACCMVDCCNFFWNGRKEGHKPFAAAGARASEFEGAMLNAQLDQLPGMVRSMRRIKKQILKATANTGLQAMPSNSPDWEVSSTLAYQLTTPSDAEHFAKLTGGVVALNTGRHTYIHWDPILQRRGAHHPAMDPYRMPQNRRCRMKVTKDMFPRSLDILARTVMISLHPDRSAKEVAALIKKVECAASSVAIPF